MLKKWQGLPLIRLADMRPDLADLAMPLVAIGSWKPAQLQQLALKLHLGRECTLGAGLAWRC